MQIRCYILFFFLTTNLFATEKWGVFEIELKGPRVDNPFTDIWVNAEFKYKNKTYYVDGFYDGNQTYKIRFMPEFEGLWTYTIKSNISKINTREGSFNCTPPTQGNRGRVKVRDTFHFGYDDGTPFYPVGTTAYAWIHQDNALIQETLNTLKENAFNKIRMTVMPKYYGRYVSNEPPYYPFEGSEKTGWKRNRFNVNFFKHLEKQVKALLELNIQADIIIFHPYDKWGFSKGDIEENQLYIKYLVARLSAYRNVWWSMANEYDIMNKPASEWEIYFKTILESDPANHLKSIHNGKEWYDYSAPYITHLSVQTPFLEKTQQWREKYSKPVVNDEFVYEGNVPFDWGNLTAEETVLRFWTLYVRGGYGSHGETYEHPDNILWWAKGGKLYGKSPKRIAFLHQIMKEAPKDGLVPLHTQWNKSMELHKTDEYHLFYYGNSQQASAIIKLPTNKMYTLEVIDKWNMTIKKLDKLYSGSIEIELPQKPYMAIRAQIN